MPRRSFITGLQFPRNQPIYISNVSPYLGTEQILMLQDSNLQNK